MHQQLPALLTLAIDVAGVDPLRLGLLWHPDPLLQQMDGDLRGFDPAQVDDFDVQRCAGLQQAGPGVADGGPAALGRQHRQQAEHLVALFPDRHQGLDVLFVDGVVIGVFGLLRGCESGIH